MKIISVTKVLFLIQTHPHQSIMNHKQAKANNEDMEPVAVATTVTTTVVEEDPESSK